MSSWEWKSSPPSPSSGHCGNWIFLHFSPLKSSSRAACSEYLISLMEIFYGKVWFLFLWLKEWHFWYWNFLSDKNYRSPLNLSKFWINFQQHLLIPLISHIIIFISISLRGHQHICNESDTPSKSAEHISMTTAVFNRLSFHLSHNRHHHQQQRCRALFDNQLSNEFTTRNDSNRWLVNYKNEKMESSARAMRKWLNIHWPLRFSVL